MKLPSGYAAESHWAWSMSDPSFWSNNTSVWAELLDDNYLLDSPKQRVTSSDKARQNNPNQMEGMEVVARARSTSVDDKQRNDSTDSTDSTDSLSEVPSRDDAPMPTSTQMVERPRVRTARSLRQKEVVDIGRNLQRIKQRQAQQLFIRTESTESIEEDDLECECTGCKGKKVTKQYGGQTRSTIQTRLNAISF
ncbi:hypothetical protein LTR84_006762 [Exophiala bonariae]|uniref:Uncharacterized protein n=1 Tax=Exophiala bonariae TaxID=1690606 RepID=A0AAV9N2Z8_9EURO|nr:hypothetical protein LTR84_006762 [Exophiala bonariae]